MMLIVAMLVLNAQISLAVESADHAFLLSGPRRLKLRPALISLWLRRVNLEESVVSRCHR